METFQTGQYGVAVIGAGPIGLACGIEAKKRGISHLILEKGCLVNSIYRYPANMTFFSTSDLLEIGGLPFPSVNPKPTRAEALEYYRRAAAAYDLNVHLYERVERVRGEDGLFEIETPRGRYGCNKVIVAAGFFDIPRPLNAIGEALPKVRHYYDEPHPYAGQDLLVVGSGNSAAIAALECFRHGAKVTMAVRGPAFHDSIKYWIRPDLENRVVAGDIEVYYNTRVAEVRERHAVLEERGGERFALPNDFVLALTGYRPDFDFLRSMGIEIGDDAHQTPARDPKTCETNRPGIYLAGVIVGGMKTNQWFIENSRVHAVRIFDHIRSPAASTEPCPEGAGS